MAWWPSKSVQSAWEVGVQKHWSLHSPFSRGTSECCRLLLTVRIFFSGVNCTSWAILYNGKLCRDRGRGSVRTHSTMEIISQWSLSLLSHNQVMLLGSRGISGDSDMFANGYSWQRMSSCSLIIFWRLVWCLFGPRNWNLQPDISYRCLVSGGLATLQPGARGQHSTCILNFGLWWAEWASMHGNLQSRASLFWLKKLVCRWFRTEWMELYMFLLFL
jgi:hypothetical protein